MAKNFLDHVYKADTPENTRDLYDDWAKTYEMEIAANGYATPERVAQALAEQSGDKAAPVLDFGCGTGLSGLALHRAGFTTLDGMDPSSEMLRQAKHKEIYRTLTAIDVADPAPVPQGQYTRMVAAGVIGPGAGPAATFDILAHALPPGGLLALSLNDHALAQGVYEAALTRWVRADRLRLLFREHGDHLPGKNINSTVYILERI